jgi:predicted MFS family arabinose efflux permease
LSWWADTTLGVDLDVAGASTDEIYAAMDWLADRQDSIEKQLVARGLGAMLTMPIAGRIMDKRGPGWVVLAGITLIAVGMATFAYGVSHQIVTVSEVVLTPNHAITLFRS